MKILRILVLLSLAILVSSQNWECISDYNNGKNTYYYFTDTDYGNFTCDTNGVILNSTRLSIYTSDDSRVNVSINYILTDNKSINVTGSNNATWVISGFTTNTSVLVEEDDTIVLALTSNLSGYVNFTRQPSSLYEIYAGTTTTTARSVTTTTIESSGRGTGTGRGGGGGGGSVTTTTIPGNITSSNIIITPSESDKEEEISLIIKTNNSISQVTIEFTTDSINKKSYYDGVLKINDTKQFFLVNYPFEETETATVTVQYYDETEGKWVTESITHEMTTTKKSSMKTLIFIIIVLYLYKKYSNKNS